MSESLYQKGYAKKSQIFELERTVLKMKGDVEANENRLTSLREQQAKARAKTERNVVTAPQDGVVMNLRTHTPGGVIAPGGDVLDLVPSARQARARGKDSADRYRRGATGSTCHGSFRGL